MQLLHVYVAATFAFFTEGLEKFNKAHEDGLITRIYSTNLTYVPETLKNAPWFYSADLSELCSRIINRLNHGRSISKYMDATRIIHDMLNGEI